jgi:hypothetical protein
MSKHMSFSFQGREAEPPKAGGEAALKMDVQTWK